MADPIDVVDVQHLVSYVKSVFVKYLRLVLQDYEQYFGVNPDTAVDTGRRIPEVYDQWPMRVRTTPFIYTGRCLPTAKKCGIGYDYVGDEVEYPTGSTEVSAASAFEVRGGYYDFPLYIHCVAASNTDAKLIIDILYAALWAINRQTFYEHSGIFIRDIMSGGEREEPYGERTLYFKGLYIICMKEWYQKALYPTVTTISASARAIGVVENVQIVDENPARVTIVDLT